MHTDDTPWAIDARDFPEDGTPHDVMRFLLGYAILAPSGHNTQPWLFDVDDRAVYLYADRTRALPVVDPDDRELTISCGAALETLCIAMRHFGYHPTVTLFPAANDPDHLATVRPGQRQDPIHAVDPLFDAIPRRRTVREPFEHWPVEPSLLAALRTNAERFGVELLTLTGDDVRHEIAGLVAEGDETQFADPHFRRELAAWIHSRHSAHHDGLSASGFGMPDSLSPVGALMVRTFNLGHRAASEDREIAEGSPALALLATAEDTPRAWLDTGRALANVLLTATASELRASYLNQPVEVASLRPRLATVAGTTANPQLLLRLGYGPVPEPSARRPLAEVFV